MATDYSARDRDANVTFYVLLWKRHGITREMFDDYWRDVHGPVCARLPGQHQYWQLHVAPNEGGIFPAVNGVESASPAEDQFSGIAELTFRSSQDRETWFRAASILMADEHNIFSKAIGYVTNPGNSRTYVDRIDVGAPNGRLGIVKLHVMVKQANGISVEAFRDYLTGRFAAAVIKSDLVLKFRLHLFEPPDVSRPDAAGVSHSELPDKQYQAAFEIAFRIAWPWKVSSHPTRMRPPSRIRRSTSSRSAAFPGAGSVHLRLWREDDVSRSTGVDGPPS